MLLKEIKLFVFVVFYKLLKPMMLRRLKEDVEKNIAPKEETIIEVLSSCVIDFIGLSYVVRANKSFD